jgi:hypothetical protein
VESQWKNLRVVSNTVGFLGADADWPAVDHMMRPFSILLLFLCSMLASVGCATERDDGENLIHSAEVDMSKLNEYLQADKENEINVESL